MQMRSVVLLGLDFDGVDLSFEFGNQNLLVSLLENESVGNGLVGNNSIEKSILLNNHP